MGKVPPFDLSRFDTDRSFAFRADKPVVAGQITEELHLLASLAQEEPAVGMVTIMLAFENGSLWLLMQSDPRE